jgi:hypothetical protein
LAKLILKPSFTAPTAPIRVEFEYFTHGTGDYFTVNSYSTNDIHLVINTIIKKTRYEDIARKR